MHGRWAEDKDGFRVLSPPAGDRESAGNGEESAEQEREAPNAEGE
jgi:hypothetical protein